MPWTGATVVGAPLPEDPQQRSELLFEAIEGRDIHVQPRYFTALERVLPSLAARSLPLTIALERASPHEKDALLDVAADAPVAKVGVLPLVTSNGNASMLVHRKHETLLGPAAMDFRKVARQK